MNILNEILDKINENNAILMRIEKSQQLSPTKTESLGPPLHKNSIPAGCYGIRWDMSEKNKPIKRIGNNILHKTLPIQSAMKRCVIDDQVLARIKKFYKRVQFFGNTVELLVSEHPVHGFTVDPWFVVNGKELPCQYFGAYKASVIKGKLSSIAGELPETNKTIVQFRELARKRGNEYYQVSFFARSAIQLLYLIEYADWDIQKIIGKGATDWSFDSWLKYGFKAVNKTGLSEKDGNNSVSVSNGDGKKGSYMSYRGIENFIGEIDEFLDGFNIKNGLVFLCNDHDKFQSDTDKSYLNTLITLPDTGWQQTIALTTMGFIPMITNDDPGSGLFSYIWMSNSGWRVACAGGALSYGAGAGVAYLYAAYGSGVANVSIGSRLCRIPKEDDPEIDEKIIKSNNVKSSQKNQKKIAEHHGN